jgi:carboxypeptidase T
MRMNRFALAMAVALFPAVMLAEPTQPADAVEVVRAWFDDPALVERAAPLLGHAQVDRAKGLLRTEADRALRQHLIELGFRVETDLEATERVARMQRAMAGDRSISGYACYRTVEETDQQIGALAAAYPDLLSLDVIGHSWQSPGHALKVAVATNATIPGPKPKLFMLSSIHAREYTPAELASRFIEDLVLGYGNDPEATWLLDHHEVHAVLQGNPDGRKKAEAGLSWRKNHNTSHCGDNNQAGADLNRNYPFMWAGIPGDGGSSSSPCAITYRGPSAESEPETQAVTDYVRSQFEPRRGPKLTDPAPDDTQGIFLDIHSYSRLVLWPWGFTSTPAPNAAALAKLGRRLAWFNDYTAEQAVGLYPTDGTTDDFAYGELGLPAYTFELGTAFFQDCGSFEGTILPDNSAALRYAARSVGAPYRWPFGPDAFNLSVEPDLVLAGEPVLLRATLDDSRQQTRVTGASGPLPPVQDVVAGSAYLGTPPWQVGAAALPMQAVDGDFDSPREELQATLDTNGLASGRHMVFVQGRDAAGNDGPPNAAFIEVVTADDAVQLQGRVRQAGTLAPLAARVQGGRFAVESDPVSGDYQRLLPPGSFDLEVSAPDHEPWFEAGVPAVAGSTVVREIELYPLCTLLHDPAEVGVASPFVAQLPWTLRSGAGNGGGGAWLPSVSGNYANNQNIALTGPVLDLTGFEAPVLQFDSRCDTERNYDFGTVEISGNGGVGWTEVFRCDGSPTWRNVELPLPALADAAMARLRFRFTSDSSVVASGWAIDNIRLRAGGPACRASQVAPVRIEAFSASPDSLVAGQASQLAWQTAHAQACHLSNDQDPTPVPLEAGELEAGQREVSPVLSTQYQLHCEGEQGPVSAAVAIEVSAPPPAVAILEFSADRVEVLAGQPVELSWRTEHAEQCEIHDDAGGTPVMLEAAERDGGGRTVFPQEATVYTLICDGWQGPVSTDLAIGVVIAPQVAISEFVATPMRIVAGNSSTLSWRTEHADACRIDNDADLPPRLLGADELAEGTAEVSPPLATVYTLRCEGVDSQDQRQLEIDVVGPGVFRDGFGDGPDRDD